MNKLFLAILIFQIGLSACHKNIAPCEGNKKYVEPTEYLTKVFAGELDTNLVYRETFDSSEASYRKLILLDSVNSCARNYIEIVNKSEGKRGVYLKSNNSNLSFYTSIYVDSIFKTEYVQTWITKRDSVTIYTSYNQDGAVLQELNPQVYVKKFNAGDKIGEDEIYENGPIMIFNRIDRSKLTGPVNVDFISVFEKEIFDIKTEHIAFEEDFYVGFKYETETYLQTGYIHMEIIERINYGGTKEVLFYVHDWGIRI